MRQIVAELIREKALRLLSDEIPHGVAVSIESMKYKKNIVDIEATIFCEQDSHKGIIIGKGGAMLKENRLHWQDQRYRGSAGKTGEPAALGEGKEGLERQ